MNKPFGACNKKCLIIGVLLILLSSGIFTFTLIRDNVADPNELEFIDWINDKRALLQNKDRETITLDHEGDLNLPPESRNSYSGGGSLLWMSKIIPNSQEPVSTPLLVDLNEDGRLEVVAMSLDDAVMAFDHTGTNYWESPYTDITVEALGATAGTSGLDYDPPPFFGSPKSYDPGDGLGHRIIVGGKDGIHCIDPEGNRFWTGGSTVGWYFSPVGIGDLEGDFRGDTMDWEIVTTSDDESRRGWVEVMDINGTIIERVEAPTGGEGGLIGTATVVEDLDGSFWDGPWRKDPEPWDEKQLEITCGNHDRGLRIWEKSGEKEDGTIKLTETTTGWLAGHQVSATHAIGNVSGSPEMEIFVGSSDGYQRCWTGWSGKLYVYTPAGTKLWDYSVGISQASIFSSPALADIQMAKFDPDETALEYEVIFGSDNGKIYVMNTASHSLQWSFDTGGRVMSSPAVCDINDDDELEVIVGSCSGKVFCFDGDPFDNIDEGINYPGDGPGQDVLWVYDTGAPVGISSPVIADMDLDGILEVVIGDMEGNVHCISAGGGCTQGKIEWPSFHLNNNNTGYYNPDRSYFIDLHPRVDPVLGPVNTSVILEPGQTHTFDLVLENLGTIETIKKEYIYLRVDERTVSDGWRYHLNTPPLGKEEDPDHVKLGKNELCNLQLQVTTPLNANRSMTAQINLIANHSIFHWVKDTILLQVGLMIRTDVEARFVHDIEDDPLSPREGLKWEPISQGGIYDIEVDVTNTGTINDTFEITLSDPPSEYGWNWSFLGMDSRRVSVTLMAPQLRGEFPGDHRTKLRVRIHCPLGAIADQDIVVTMTSSSALARDVFQVDKLDIDQIHLIVSTDNGLWLDFVGSAYSGMPGSTLDIPIRVTNLGNRESEVVRLMSDPLLEGWSVELVTEPIFVIKGQTRTIPIRVSIPDAARAGTRMILTIRGSLMDSPHIRSQASITVGVEQIFDHDVSNEGDQTVMGLPGDQVDLGVHAVNNGNGEEEMRFSTDLPEDWEHLLLDGLERTIDSILLEPGTDQGVLIRVWIPEGMLEGEYNVIVIIQTPIGNEYLKFQVVVQKVRGMSLEGIDGESSLLMSTRISKETRFRCSIENTGNGIDEINVMIGGLGLWGSMLEVPKGTHVGLSSIADHIDQKGDVSAWNSSRPLDPSEHPPNTLHVPQRMIFGGMSARNDPVQGFIMRLRPGEIMFIEYWLKQETNEVGVPIRSTDLLVAALTDDIRTILPVHVNLLYPDIYIVEDIQILGGSKGDPGSAREGDRLTFVVKVGNKGEVTAEDVIVQMYVDGHPETNITLPFITVSENQQKIAILTWEAKEGKHEIRIELDPGGSIYEVEDLDPGLSGNEDKFVARVNVEGNGQILGTTGIMVLSMFLLATVLVSAGWFLTQRKQLPDNKE